MPLITKILVPFDGSTYAENALKYAVELANSVGYLPGVGGPGQSRDPQRKEGHRVT